MPLPAASFTVQKAGVAVPVGEGVPVGVPEVVTEAVMEGDAPADREAVGVPVLVGDANSTQAMDTLPSPPLTPSAAPPLLATV